MKNLIKRVRKEVEYNPMQNSGYRMVEDGWRMMLTPSERLEDCILKYRLGIYERIFGKTEEESLIKAFEGYSEDEFQDKEIMLGLSIFHLGVEECLDSYGDLRKKDSSKRWIQAMIEDRGPKYRATITLYEEGWESALPLLEVLPSGDLREKLSYGYSADANAGSALLSKLKE